MSLSRFVRQTFADVAIIPPRNTGSLPSIPVPAGQHGLASKVYVHEAIADALQKAATTPGEEEPGDGVTEEVPGTTVPATLPANAEFQTLNVTGSARFSGSVTVPAPTEEDHAASRVYVDDSIAHAGAGAALDVTTIAGEGLRTQDGKLAILQPFSDLTVNGTAMFKGGVLVRTPATAQEAVNKTYADGLLRTAGPGLVLTGTELAVSDSLAHVTNVGILRGLHVQGPAAFSANVTVRTPVDAGDACPKSYVDAAGLRSGASFQYVTVADGDTVSLTASRITLDAPAPLAALTLTLPTGENGRYISITSTQDVGAITFANGTVRAAKITALTAEVPASLVYHAGPNEWFAA
jgi:hypothetical protein